MQPPVGSSGAVPDDMVPPLTRAELTDRARSLAVQPWSHRLHWFYAATDAGLAAYGGLLWATGYPRWRAGVAIAVAMAWAAGHALELRARSRSDEQTVTRRAGVTLWMMLATGFAVVAVTGGIRSPLVPGAVAALPLYLFQYGWTTRTKLYWGATALGIGVVALLPRQWVGSEVAEVVYWVVVAGNVLAMLAATVVYLALLTRVAHESVREANRAREELALQAMARARELEQLGAQLSHELKNPLSAIKTLVQISARAVQDAESRERLEVIESEIRRMQQVLQDYLSFSRPLEKIRPQEVQLAAIVEDVVALLAGRAAAANVVFRARGDARVVADPLRIKEALLNLVANAVEASPPGSRVEVAIAQDGSSARLVVIDSGRGMAPDVLARIGTPFFTTREEGTGLGVALARATFVRHGGTLTYESRPGEGTTATATLPAVAARRMDGARARSG
jgi:signal transduction histidine kinase